MSRRLDPLSSYRRLTDSYLADFARSAPNEVVLYEGGRTWSAGMLDDQVNRAAQAFMALGVVKGDVVSWQLPNWADAIVIHFAAIRIGAISNPIVPIFRASEMDFILRQARSKVCLVPAIFRGFNHARMLVGLANDLPDLVAGLAVRGEATTELPDASHFFSGFSAVPPDVKRSPSDRCLLLYTSGTTAEPKGVLHSHRTLDYENHAVIETYKLKPGSESIFMPSPLAHITGVLYGIQLPFMIRSKVVLQDIWKPEEAVGLIDRHRCTFMLAATPFLHGILSEVDAGHGAGSSLRVFACGGADVPPDLIRRASAMLGCHATRVYGSTEFPTATTSEPGDNISNCSETDGLPMAGVEVVIADDDGRSLPSGSVGEVKLRGPEMFLGYLDDRLNKGTLDDEGFFSTGDVGITSEDGYLTIIGRKKDIIIRGGENLSAKEIEDHVFEHPQVEDVAVVGYPDPVLGERVAVFVVARGEQELKLADIVLWLTTRDIAKQKLPELLVTIAELPRTQSGKIQKFKLREMLLDTSRVEGG